MTTEPLPRGEILRRQDLTARGWRGSQITTAVRSGGLVRLRRDRYAASESGDVGRAVRVGGRLGCVSLLALLGVFVQDASRLHIHLDRTMSRMRSPHDAGRRLSRADRSTLALHWWPLRGDEASLGAVGLPDAVAQAVRCQPPRAAVATIDSVRHLGLLTAAELHEVFASLPHRYGIVLRLSDGIAESGPETYVRLILRQLGVAFEAQVVIPGVGRVDFVVDGWLIVECDSRAFHEGWAKQKEDRRRDLAAAARGYSTVRPLAEDIFSDPDVVIAALRGLLRTRRPRRPAR